MVIICKEIYFVSYLQMETVDRDKIVNDDFPNENAHLQLLFSVPWAFFI